MKFSRLKITGFKSFCDAAELHLEPGLTGVVGPNGCGKSNLVEAMRWVMGESSYKAMRASGMDDVIFSGTHGRPGRNSAEVSLVVDNSDRTAPAPLNNADILEITRRIERDSGSIYRVNGREVRARDVQLLFADASTGARSPAMVRQGQIGELIAAKPVKRRALLEEAAGISGLHSRRHEAELRLRAAEQNLERVDDVIAQIETQLEALKRQARQAVRYRSLSGDVRRTEALLFHIRWVQARHAEKETEAEQGRLIDSLAEATHAERLAARGMESAEADLKPLREAEAAASAALQRLTIASEQLRDEIDRAEARRVELENRGQQIETDGERERAQVAESDELLGQYARERDALNAEARSADEATSAAREEADSARKTLAEAESEARAAADAASELRARRAQLTRSLEDANARIARLRQQVAEVRDEAERLRREVEADETVVAERAALETAQAHATEAEQAALGAEEDSARAQEKLDAARPALEEIDSALNRLEGEAKTLERVLNMGGDSQWPPLVDSLDVTPGYETALGAALGDDLDAALDDAAPIHWAASGAGATDPGLPEGITPLSRFVSGPSVLQRRLEQTGLVSEEDGERFARDLAPGQRLVSKAGALWRWDGLRAAADAPTAAAQRLAQRNRLSEIEEEIADLRNRRRARHEEIEALKAAVETARRGEKDRHDAWREAQRTIVEAQKRLDLAQKAMVEQTSRQSALAEAEVRLKSSLEEAEAIAADSRNGLDEAGDADLAAEKLTDIERRVAALRETAEEARLKLSGFENAAQLRQTRLSQIAGEIGNWQRRAEQARAQLATLEARAREVAGELAALKATPDDHAARRAALDEQIDEARENHKRAADRLAAAESANRDADRAVREASEALSLVRADMARVEERLKGNIAQRQQIERAISETLGIAANKTAEVAGLKPEQSLPDESQIEGRLNRLKSERERLGAVNLMAEKEAEEIGEKLETMTADREDLIAAIAKLRTGISNLNREGRARLNEAFKTVNAHFQDLFTGLFGGGEAELTFVESDDPLEAGLEIIARPPGKKPQTMTLLSGGEQALTAMSLIFAVFLTNPAPICVLDEVDAPLDDANVERFCDLLDTMCKRTETRFVVITHNPITMARVDRLFGVTMAEKGVSQLVSVDLSFAQAVREAG